MNDTDIPVTDRRHPQWKQGRIRSRASKERWTLVGMALVWNAIAQPLFWFVALDDANVDPVATWVTALFPLAGFGLIYAAAVKWLQWRRFGNLELVMDPFPGSPGGDVGGVIEIPTRYQPGTTVQITLSCINVIIRRGGKNNSRSENALWLERAELAVEPGMRGSRVSFRFKVPADQPTTTEPSDNCIKWVVHIHREMPGADLDQTFELPVLDTGTPQQSRRIHKYSLQIAEAARLPEHDIVMARTAEGLRFFYPASRNRGMGLAMLLFGACFGIVPWMFSTGFSDIASGDAFGMIFILFGGFFVLVFGVIGLLLVTFGIYSLFNSLDVKITGQGIVSTRNVLGLTFRHALQRKDIRELRFKINVRQGQGVKAKLHYLLEAIPASGKPVCLGDGIKGKPLARRLMQELGEALGHTEWSEGRRLSARLRSGTA